MDGQSVKVSSMEFVIDELQTPMLEDNICRIEELFNVSIKFGNSFKVMNKVKQWLTLQSEGSRGSIEKSQKAKTFCLAIINPEITLDTEKNTIITKHDRDTIERESAAFLCHQDERWRIQGTHLCVALAESIIDDIMSRARPKVPSACTALDYNNSSDPHSKTSWPSTGSCDREPAAAQQEKSVNHVQVEQFGPRPNRFVSMHPNVAPLKSNPQQSFARDHSGPFTSTNYNNHSNRDFSNVSDFQTSKDRVIPGRTSEMKVDSVLPWPSTGVHSEQMSKTEEQRMYLRNLAASCHYSPEDIERGLNASDMNEVIKPADFLNRLKEMKETRYGEGYQQVSSLHHQFIPPKNPVSFMSPANRQLSNSTAKTHAKNDGSLPSDIIIISSDDDENVYDVESESMEEQRLGVGQPAECALVQDKTIGHTHLMDGKNCSDKTEGAQRNRSSRRYIIIDGSNVAMSHGNRQVFSVPGIQICINYFLERGHKVMAFVPETRRYSNNHVPIVGKSLLEKLEMEGVLKFTPARRLNGKVIAAYDDRFILSLAEKEDGVVVSNDLFRDLVTEKDSYKKIVESRLLQFVFVGDHFMPPDDPLGRNGPTLEEFLCFPQPSKCRTRRTLSNGLVTASHKKTSQPPNAGVKKYSHLQGPQAGHKHPEGTSADKQIPNTLAKTDRTRGHDETQILFYQLQQLFPNENQKACIWKVLDNHKEETDVTRLSNYCLNALAM